MTTRQYKTIQGGPAPGYDREPPYHEHSDHIAAQLERCSREGWRLVHTASHMRVTTDSHAEPTFFCLLEREDPQ